MTEADATVLVVDDDEPMRQSLKNLIRSVGLRVEAFASAQSDSLKSLDLVWISGLIACCYRLFATLLILAADISAFVDIPTRRGA